MNEPLFRQEAIDASKQKLMGSVRLFTPPYGWLMTGTVAMLALATTLFFVFGSYTKRERVIGQLLPTQGLLTAAPSSAGTVISTLVKEGQPVQKDTPLLTVSTETATNLGGTREMIGEQLKLQRTKLNTALVSRAELNEAQWHGLQMRAGQMKSQLAEVDEEKLERQRQIVLARQQLEKIQLMHDKGYASNTQLEQQEDTVLSAEGRLRELARQRLETEQQLSAITQQLRELPLNTRNEHDEIERKLADLDQAIVENESRRETILRAPENAVVAALLAKPGQTIGAGQTAVTLLPAGAKLEAQLMVPSRAIGFIRRDERVVLRYQAYPYQKFGQQYGRVSEVSRTALWPQEVSLLTGQPNVVEQQYRVVVALDRQDIMAYGNAESLRSGMALEADILIDTRSLIEWVLEPIVAIGRRMSS